MKNIATYVPKALKVLNKYSKVRKNRLRNSNITDEKAFIEKTKTFLKKRFKTKIFVYSEDDKQRYDPKDRARLAIPGQPAIFIE